MHSLQSHNNNELHFRLLDMFGAAINNCACAHAGNSSNVKTVCDLALKTPSKGENAILREKFRLLEERIMQLEKIEDRMDALEDKMAELAERDGTLFLCIQATLSHGQSLEPRRDSLTVGKGKECNPKSVVYHWLV